MPSPAAWPNRLWFWLRELRRGRAAPPGCRGCSRVRATGWHGYSPMRHGAARIVDCNSREFFFRLFVPEGMQQGYAALEPLLHRYGARNREGHDTELRRGQLFMVMRSIVIGKCGTSKSSPCDKRRNGAKPHNSFHENPARSEFSRAQDSRSKGGPAR